MLSKISQTEKNKYCMISIICVIKKNLIAIRVDWWFLGASGGVGNMSEGN